MNILMGIGVLFYIGFILGFLALYVYVLVLLIKFLRRGIKACDKYLSEDDTNNNYFNE